MRTQPHPTPDTPGKPDRQLLRGPDPIHRITDVWGLHGASIARGGFARPERPPDVPQIMRDIVAVGECDKMRAIRKDPIE